MPNKPITRLCVDCKQRLKNLSRATKRCRKCYYAFARLTAKGLQTGICSECGAKLSTKKNITGKCKNCCPRGTNLVAWQRIPNTPPWNKGRSAFPTHEAYRKHVNEKRKTMRASSPVDIADRIRTLIRLSLKRASVRKDTKTATLLGCDTKFFKKHLEAQFTEGMGWDNYGNGVGRWNIDHIKPLVLFDLSDPAHQLEAFHYMNCRPLWAIENSRRQFEFPRSRRGSRMS